MGDVKTKKQFQFPRDTKERRRSYLCAHLVLKLRQAVRSLLLAVRVRAALALLALAAGLALRGGGRRGGGGGRRRGRRRRMAAHRHGGVIYVRFIRHLGKAELKHVLEQKRRPKHGVKTRTFGGSLKQSGCQTVHKSAHNPVLESCCLTVDQTSIFETLHTHSHKVGVCF